MTRTCRKCLRGLDRSMFYKHPNGRDGLQEKCKECARAATMANRLSKADYYQEYDRNRAMAPHRVAKRAAYRATDQGKKSFAAASRKDIELRPEKRTARTAVSNAIKVGRLSKGPCETCGSPEAEAHHDDYSKPLDVRWLCSTHHHEHHRKERENASWRPTIEWAVGK